jgi:hypothetical protein
MICLDKPAQKMLANFSCGRETDTTMARVRSITGRQNVSLSDGWRLALTASAAVAASDTRSGALDWIAARDNAIRHIHTTPRGHSVLAIDPGRSVGRRSRSVQIEDSYFRAEDEGFHFPPGGERMVRLLATPISDTTPAGEIFAMNGGAGARYEG